MAQPQITINRNAGGLGRPTAGTDHISGMLFFNAVLPSGFGVSDRIKKVQSIEDAEGLGIIEGGTHDVEWYHLNQLFIANEKCVLYVGVYDEPVDYTVHAFPEVSLMQVFADGDIKQMGVYTGDQIFATAIVSALNTVATTLATEKRGLNIGWSADESATVDITTLSSIRNAAKYVSVLLGQDGNATGKALATSKGFSIGMIGLWIGVVSLSAVHESIGYVGKFNVVSGAEFDVPAFTNGQLVKDISNTALDTLNDNGFIFLKKFTDYSGTYFNFGHTAIVETSDFATIENNRTIEKAIRLTNVSVLPLLNSPLTVDPVSGELSEDTIKTFEAFADKGIEQMQRNGELSGRAVVIDPTQDVLTTSKVVIALKLIPRGVAKEIVVNIGFATSI